jgi:hypothetical protein
MRGFRRFGRFVCGVMCAGGLLAGTPSFGEDCGPPSLERAIVERVTAEGDVVLSDARRLRLAGLYLHQVDPLLWPKAGDAVAVGLLGEDKDRWSRHAAMVFTLPDGQSPEWLQATLLSRGSALVRPETVLGGCWPLLTAAEAQHEGKLPKTAAEGGRFVRVSGRVQRVGDGRSAHFITVFDRSGERLTGMVQKRHLRRFTDAGVDVKQLRGQVIRMRGIRSVSNTSLISLMMAEQIEIVR